MRLNALVKITQRRITPSHFGEGRGERGELNSNKLASLLSNAVHEDFGDEHTVRVYQKFEEFCQSWIVATASTSLKVATCAI